MCTSELYDVSVLLQTQETFLDVVNYFGENPKLSQPNSIFPVLQRFVEGFQVSIILSVVV